jgi:hypothetical protein
MLPAHRASAHEAAEAPSGPQEASYGPAWHVRARGAVPRLSGAYRGHWRSHAYVTGTGCVVGAGYCQRRTGLVTGPDLRKVIPSDIQPEVSV